MPDDRIRAARALRARGISRGDVEMLEQAADAFGVLGYAIEQGQAWLEAAERAPRRRAVPLARDAVARFVELDVPALAERAQATLARHEPRPSRARSGPRATTGWESLTKTEWLVVEEVCAGRSNGEAAANLGISRRTVESHLRSIYTKLDIRSRVALVVGHTTRTG
jgi:DNA-binding CsgD family transcriptional regulator